MTAEALHQEKKKSIQEKQETVLKPKESIRKHSHLKNDPEVKSASSEADEVNNKKGSIDSVKHSSSHRKLSGTHKERKDSHKKSVDHESSKHESHRKHSDTQKERQDSHKKSVDHKTEQPTPEASNRESEMKLEPPQEFPSQSIEQEEEQIETAEPEEAEETKLEESPSLFLRDKVTFDWLKQKDPLEKNQTKEPERNNSAVDLVRNLFVNIKQDPSQNVLRFNKIDFTNQDPILDIQIEEDTSPEPFAHLKKPMRRTKEWIVQCRKQRRNKNYTVDDVDEESKPTYVVTLSSQVSIDSIKTEEHPRIAPISEWGHFTSVKAFRGSAVDTMSKIPSVYNSTAPSQIQSRYNRTVSTVSQSHRNESESQGNLDETFDEPIWQRGRHFDHATDPFKKHFISIINTLNYDIKIMETTQSTLLGEIRDQYKKYNANIDNYRWRDVYEKPLDFELTLHQNGLVDNSYITDEIGLDYYPLILLYFNDGFENDPPMQLDIRKAFFRDKDLLCRNYELALAEEIKSKKSKMAAEKSAPSLSKSSNLRKQSKKESIKRDRLSSMEEIELKLIDLHQSIQSFVKPEHEEDEEDEDEIEDEDNEDEEEDENEELNRKESKKMSKSNFVTAAPSQIESRKNSLIKTDADEHADVDGEESKVEVEEKKFSRKPSESKERKNSKGEGSRKNSKDETKRKSTSGEEHPQESKGPKKNSTAMTEDLMAMKPDATISLKTMLLGQQHKKSDGLAQGDLVEEHEEKTEVKVNQNDPSSRKGSLETKAVD